MPCVVFAARKVLANSGQKAKAIRLIFRAWEENAQSPAGRIRCASIIDKRDSPSSNEKWMKKLTRIRPEPARDEASWTCSNCGQTAPGWLAHCLACDAFDTLECRKNANLNSLIKKFYL